MAAGNTYTKVASYTMPSNGNTVTFSSISQAYTDLRIIIQGSSTTACDFRTRIGNGSADSGANYYRTLAFAYGTAPNKYGGSNASETSLINTMYTYQNTIIMDFNSYTNAYRKTVLHRDNSAVDFVYMASSLWNSTSAINYIEFTNASYNFTTGTSFTIYGILAA